MFYMAKKEATQAGSLKRPQDNSFLTQETYHCSYGPQDNRSCVPEALTQKQPSQGSRVSETARGESRKHGCLSHFTASRLYLYPDVMRLSIRNSDHTDAHGNAVHGCGNQKQYLHRMNSTPVVGTGSIGVRRCRKLLTVAKTLPTVNKVS